MSASVTYSPSRARHDIVYVRPLETVESGGGSHGVGTHVLKDQPVTHLQVRQVTLLNDAIKAITCWTPDTTGVPDLIWLWLLFFFVFRRGRVGKEHRV